MANGLRERSQELAAAVPFTKGSMAGHEESGMDAAAEAAAAAIFRLDGGTACKTQLDLSQRRECGERRPSKYTKGLTVGRKVSGYR